MYLPNNGHNTKISKQMYLNYFVHVDSLVGNVI